MHDKELVLEVLRQIEEAAKKIITRFAGIRQVSDFTDSPAAIFGGGLDKSHRHEGYPDPSLC
jgi:hypothetical protein